MKRVRFFLDRGEDEMLRCTDDLYKALTRLRYEGKVFRGKNIKAAAKAVQSLGNSAERHRRLQEKVLFPFLEEHFPGRAAAVPLLEAEHDDIFKNKKKLSAHLKELKNKPAAAGGEAKIYQIGVYLVSLLRHHMQFEKKSVRRPLVRQLRPHERDEIKKRVKQWQREFLRR